MSVSERLAGFKRAMDESGLPVRPDRVLLGEYSRHYGHAAANQLMLELSGPLLCWPVQILSP